MSDYTTLEDRVQEALLVLDGIYECGRIDHRDYSDLHDAIEMIVGDGE